MKPQLKKADQVTHQSKLFWRSKRSHRPEMVLLHIEPMMAHVMREVTDVDGRGTRRQRTANELVGPVRRLANQAIFIGPSG